VNVEKEEFIKKTMTEIENKNITRLEFVQKLANKNLPMHKLYIFILHVARKSWTQLGYHDVYLCVLGRNSYAALPTLQILSQNNKLRFSV
jgi:hypothetical protein